MHWPVTSLLVTPRLRLEPLTVAHAPEMVEVLAPAELYAYTDGEPPTEEELGHRYAVQSVGHSPARDAGWLNWIIRRTATGDVAGFVQASLVMGDEGLVADVAWLVTPSAQFDGIASEASCAMLDWLRSQQVVLVRALIHPDHHASARVAERIGLTASGDFEDGEAVWQSAASSPEA